MRDVLIGILLVLCAYLADRVREENQRYAMIVGMCRSSEPKPVLPFNFACLDRVQTRVAWWWHLYYAVKDPLPPVPLISTD